MRVVIGTVLGDYSGVRAIQQENALNSWKSISGLAEICVFHWSPAHGELLARMDLMPVYGIPTFHGHGRYQSIPHIVSHLLERAEGGIAVLVNSDVILRPSLLQRLVKPDIGPEWVAVSRRWDIEVNERIEGDIEKFCGRMTSAHAVLHDAGGIDFFAFHTKRRLQFPDIFIGISAWDNIAMYSLRKHGLPILDLSPLSGVFHQQHLPRYSARGEREAYFSEEAQHHEKLMSDRRRLFTVDSATHVVGPDRVYPSWRIPRSAQRRCIDCALLSDWPELLILVARVGGVLAKVVSNSINKVLRPPGCIVRYAAATRNQSTLDKAESD